MYIVGRRIGVPRRAFGPLDRPARQPCRSGDRPRFRRPGCARLRASVPPDGALWSGRPARRGGASPEHWQGIRPVELREAAGDRPAGPGAPRLPGWTAALPAAAPTPGGAGEERRAKGVPRACSEHRGAFLGARVGIHSRGRCRIPLIQRGGLIAEHVPDRDSACPARIDRAQDLPARLPRHAGALPGAGTPNSPPPHPAFAPQACVDGSAVLRLLEQHRVAKHSQVFGRHVVILVVSPGLVQVHARRGDRRRGRGYRRCDLDPLPGTEKLEDVKDDPPQ